MRLRFPLRRLRHPEQPVVVEPPSPPPPPPRLLASLRVGGGWLRGALSAGRRAVAALDQGFVWFAVPFGVGVRDPRRRYALLLGSSP
jgi:hypothetical protein